MNKILSLNNLRVRAILGQSGCKTLSVSKHIRSCHPARSVICLVITCNPEGNSYRKLFTHTYNIMDSNLTGMNKWYATSTLAA